MCLKTIFWASGVRMVVVEMLKRLGTRPGVAFGQVHPQLIHLLPSNLTQKTPSSQATLCVHMFSNGEKSIWHRFAMWEAVWPSTDTFSFYVVLFFPSVIDAYQTSNHSILH